MVDFPVESSDEAVRNAGETLMAFTRGGDTASFCHYDGQRSFCFEYGIAAQTFAMTVSE